MLCFPPALQAVPPVPASTGGIVLIHFHATARRLPSRPIAASASALPRCCPLSSAAQRDSPTPAVPHRDLAASRALVHLHLLPEWLSLATPELLDATLSRHIPIPARSALPNVDHAGGGGGESLGSCYARYGNERRSTPRRSGA